MKRIIVGYFAVLWSILFFTGCKNHDEHTAAGNPDPVFQRYPDLKNITEQITNAPKNAALYYERGTMLHKLHMDTLAIKDYKAAVSLDSSKAEYYSAVGDLLFENKDITGSVHWLQTAIAKNPSDRKAHLKIAKLFLYIRDYNKAFHEINIVEQQNVYDPEAYFLKGMVYKDMKDTAKAISSFQTAVEVSPDDRQAVVQLALLYSAQKNPIALQYLDKAYKMDSTDAFPLFAKGVYYQDNKDYDNAKQEYKRCILRDSHYADAYFNMGYILMQQDSAAKAWRQYYIVGKIDPGNPAAYYNMGVCSERMDSVKKAIGEYKQAAMLDTGYESPRKALRRLGAKD